MLRFGLSARTVLSFSAFGEGGGVVRFRSVFPSNEGGGEELGVVELPCEELASGMIMETSS